MLSVKGVAVSLGSRRILHEVDMEAGPGEVTALLGPSGCGKTTLLRAVAGLIPIESGKIAIGGRDVTNEPAHRRGAALVFQDLALFPHRDVAGNVGFGLRMRNVPQGERERRVAQVLELVGLPGTERRPVQELSGGQRQRVALARALAPEPDVLMLDEPLRSLDRAIRDRLLDELASIVRGLDRTVVYVTHDTSETFRVADRVVLMREGRIVQAGPVREVWRRPVDEEAARLLGHVNFADGLVANGRLRLGWAEVAVPQGAPEGNVRLLIRTDAVRLGGRDATGVVLSSRFEGGWTSVKIEMAPGVTLVAHAAAEGPQAGTRVGIGLDPSGIVILPADPAA